MTDAYTDAADAVYAYWSTSCSEEDTLHEWLMTQEATEAAHEVAKVSVDAYLANAFRCPECEDPGRPRRKGYGAETNGE